MFSRTVSPANGCAIWNVRAMPRRASRCGGRPVMSAPSKNTRPSVGGEESGDDREQRGLAGAVRADQRGDAAGFAVNEAAIDGEQPAEAARDVLDAQHLGHGRRLSRPAMPRGANATTTISTQP